MPKVPGRPEPALSVEELLESGIPRRRAVLASRVGKLRVQKGWTRYTLAKKAQMNPTHFKNIELGGVDPTLETLVRLAVILDLAAVEQLFGPLPTQEVVEAAETQS